MFRNLILFVSLSVRRANTVDVLILYSLVTFAGIINAKDLAFFEPTWYGWIAYNSFILS